jgi:hypothetical protein
MCLPSIQVNQFFQIWLPLLNFANEYLEVVPSFYVKGTKDKVDIKNAIKVRDALWKNVNVLVQFIMNNPFQLSSDEISIVDNWRHHRQEKFILFKALKKHAIFISQDKKEEVYAVKGLKSSMEELFGPYIPLMIDAVLLPFNGEIITDGLFHTNRITFGSGIRSSLKSAYDDAKERGEIISSLLPATEILPHEIRVAKAQKTNEKVLGSFQRHLYTSGLSQQTVIRDVFAIEFFGQSLTMKQPDPASLRDFRETDISSHLQFLPEPLQKKICTSLKRFIAFLRDTERVEWEDAESLLEFIKTTGSQTF